MKECKERARLIKNTFTIGSHATFFLKCFSNHLRFVLINRSLNV